MTRTLPRLLLLILIAVPAFAQEPSATSGPAGPLVVTSPPGPAPDASNDDYTKAVYFGRKFFDLKDYTSAYEQFSKADQLQPDRPAVLYDMALVLAKAGRFSESQTRVDRYLQLYPGEAERPLIAKLQLELEFQRELQKKRQADTDYIELFTRGRYLYQKNDLDGALRLFQTAAEQRPEDPASVFDEGVIYEKRGELQKAAERFHKFEGMEHDVDQKGIVDQRLLLLEGELEDMTTRIVCAFCGFRLPVGATWCPHCWHGPYLTSSALWSSRPCGEGANATLATYFSDDRFSRNETLPCLFNGPMLDALRYTPARQHAIQDARKAEGWTYSGEVIQGKGRDVRYVQGPDYLHRILATSGEVLNFAAHKSPEGFWLLDREDQVIAGQLYTSHYSFDPSNRIVRQQVSYQNTSGCNHLIAMTADFTYTGDALTSVTLRGGYDGAVVEGSPRMDWLAGLTYAYDPLGRTMREELVVKSMTKTYNAKPYGAARDEIAKLYPAMRVRRPLENILRTGDLCASSGTLLLGNPIDLRPFYAMSPNMAMVIPYGVAKAVVSFTYPEGYKLR